MISDAMRVQQAKALVVTGILLYVPANVLPVMTMTIVGDVAPLTVFGGVEELYDSDLIGMAALVFLASIVVPFLKLLSLSWILLLHGKSVSQRKRNVLLRIVRTVGSWSMVDIFLLSTLAAVAQLGVLAGVQAEPGAFFFAAVLICSLLAAEIYKPRMIWQTDQNQI